jgi:hypothetical protein
MAMVMIQQANRLCVSLLLSCLPLLAVAQEIQQTITPNIRVVSVCSPQQLVVLNERVAALAKAGSELRALASQPVPKGLAYDETKQAYRYRQWLHTTGDRLDALEIKARQLVQYCEPKRHPDSRIVAKEEMAEMSRSFNLQYLQLQNTISEENRQFTMISNIMKNRHDAAKNAINNIR